MTVGTQAAANGTQPSYLASETGVGGWFATHDHKKIGLMFAGWTSFAFLLGALFGLVPCDRPFNVHPNAHCDVSWLDQFRRTNTI